MKRYLLKGEQSHLVSGEGFIGVQSKPVEYEVDADDDKHARERARQYSNVLNPSLFVEIGMSEDMSTADNHQTASEKEQMVYRVVAARHDILPHVVETFKAPSNDEAKKVFDKDYVRNKNYRLDWLDLERVDQVEKTTLIARKD